MRELITDAMVEVAARAEADVSWPTTAWDGLPYDVRAVFVDHARAALDAAAPLIAAAAWDEGYATSHLEWEHVYDGHTIDPDVDDQMCTECGKGNPYA